MSLCFRCLAAHFGWHFYIVKLRSNVLIALIRAEPSPGQIIIIRGRSATMQLSASQRCFRQSQTAPVINRVAQPLPACRGGSVCQPVEHPRNLLLGIASLVCASLSGCASCRRGCRTINDITYSSSSSGCCSKCAQTFPCCVCVRRACAPERAGTGRACTAAPSHEQR